MIMAVLRTLKLLCVILVVSVLGACGGRKPAVVVTPASPAEFELELLVTGAFSEVLSGDALAAENAKLQIPEGTPPTAMVWCAQPPEMAGQALLAPPVFEASDSETHLSIRTREVGGVLEEHRIAGWEFAVDEPTTVTLRRVFRVRLSGQPPYAGSTDGSYDLTDSYITEYLKPERFHEMTPAMTALLPSIVGKEQNPLEKARLVFRYVRKHMTYEYPPATGRGADKAFERGRGDCGQYADLFIALCRAAGVPARFVGGLRVGPDEATGKLTVGSHAWAEVLLPNGVWVPMDPTGPEEKFFAQLASNEHLTISRGRNLELPGAPVWAREDFSEVGNQRADMMQTYTELVTGLRGGFSARRRARALTSE